MTYAFNVLIFILFFAQHLHAEVDPDIKWSTLTTEHFEIIYPTNQQAMGQKFATAAEQAYQLLIPIFKEAPSQTTVVLSDNTDTANGSAHFMPGPIIRLNMTPPSEFELFAYDDWALLLMVHEYTHILNFYPAHGVYTPLKYIFGNIIRPNALLPNWYLEGLAVNLESRLTALGRLNSRRTDAVLRALSLSGQLQQETIDKINEHYLKRWPDGHRPYLLGGAFLNYLHELGGDELIFDLNQRYSRRLPFLLNGPVHDKLGKSYARLLRDHHSELVAHSKEQLEVVRSKPGKKKLIYNGHRGQQISPRISPDSQKLVFIGENQGEGSIYIIKKNDSDQSGFIKNKAKRLHTGSKIMKVDWHPNSQSFIFSKLNRVDRYNQNFDIYSYDLKSEQVRVLTHGARAIFATYAKDGSKIYFLRREAGLSQLMQMTSEGREIKSLITVPIDEAITSLTVNDQQQLFYTRQMKNGQIGLFRYSLIDQKSERVLAQFNDMRQIHFTPHGLIFVSDKNGIPNLYLAAKDLTFAQPQTNTSTEIFNADIDPKSSQIVASELTAKGLKLSFHAGLKGLELAQVPPLIKNAKSNIDNGYTSAPGPQAKIDSQAEDYAPLTYLYPRYWMPFLYPIEGGTLLQGTTEAADPLYKHAYFLNASFDTLSEKWSYAVNYVNQTTPIKTSLAYSQIQRFLISTEILVENQATAIGFGIYPTSSLNWVTELGGVEEKSRIGTIERQRHGPTAAVQYQPATLSSFDNSAQFRLQHQHFIEGGEFIAYDRTTLLFNAKLKSWLPSQHSLNFDLRGSYAPTLSDDLVSALMLGDTTTNGVYSATLLSSVFLMRGYPSGTFVGRTLANASLSYDLPIIDIYAGAGTLPLFLRDIVMSTFVDTIYLDGYSFESDRDLYMRDEFTRAHAGAGVEFIMNTTAAYHMPLSFRLGLHYGIDKAYQGGSKVFLALGFGGFESADQHVSD